MPREPVILLTFANQQDAYLANLKRESTQIEQALAKIVDQGAVRLWRKESTDTADLIGAFNRFDGKVAIFHYGGHAHGKGLELEDALGLSEGLAQHLSRQQSLKLVFLNGCSTKKLVERLLQLGVAAVIGTQSAIDDQKATAFAGFFYDKLANKGTVRQAFEYARNSLLLLYEEQVPMKIQSVAVGRGIKIGESYDIFPWGLYFNEQQADVLNWTLPAPEIRLSRELIRESTYEVNDFLYPVLEEMAAYVPKIREELQEIEDEREYFEMIIKNFPWNIGSQFGLLVGERELDAPRLEQIVSTYMACGQWLYFVPLSQLWQERLEEKIHEFKGRPSEAFTIKADNFLQYDFLRSFRQVMGELEESKIPLFVNELKPLADALEKNGELYDSYLLLESIRSRMLKEELPGPGPEFRQICIDAEFALAQLLCKLAFVVKYQMVTVREIILFNPRHRETRYFHKIGRLNAHTDDRLFFFKNPKSYEEFLENDSVLLLKDTEHIDQYLSLSPFFIDRNAYLDKNSDLTDLYTYGFARPGNTAGKMTFHYLKSSRNLISASYNKLDQTSTSEEEQSRFDRRSPVKRFKSNSKKQPYLLLQEQFNKLLELLQ